MFSQKDVISTDQVHMKPSKAAEYFKFMISKL